MGKARQDRKKRQAAARAAAHPHPELLESAEQALKADPPAQEEPVVEPDQADGDGPAFPMESWSIEEPFDSSIYLQRAAAGPDDDAEQEPAEQ